MLKAERFLPVILAILLPPLGMLANDFEPDADIPVPVALFRYMEAVSVFLGIWFLNQWLLRPTKSQISKPLRYVRWALINIGFLVSFFSLDYLLFDIGLTAVVSLTAFTVRLIMITLVFSVIIWAINGQKAQNSLQVQNMELESEKLAFQLENLKQQINPHFLFNSLNTLLDLVEDDQEAAAKYLRSFSKLYRTVLQSASHDFVLLADELEFLEHYWRLLKVRFRDAISLDIQLDEDLKNQFLPPMSLQLLIENAVKHNEASADKPLTISITGNSEGLTISNALNPKQYPVASEGVGLSNLHNRFSLLLRPIQYGRKGDQFVVHLPLKAS